VQTSLVDPRDTTWEVRDTRYRVNFWERLSPVPGVAPEDMGYSCDVVEVAGADVEQVLDWARQTAGPGRSYTIDVLVPHAGEKGLVRIVGGQDPTEAPAPEQSFRR
jgi:hypothetical protein